MSHASIELHSTRAHTLPAPSEARSVRPEMPRILRASRRLPPPVRFVDDVHRAQTLADAERARAIVLLPVCLGPGQLKGAIDADLESVLASRGAMPSQIRADAPYRAIVEDQLARAASLPVRGVCLSMPVLADLCESTDSLHEDDLRTLSVWVEAAKVQRKLRVVVLLSELDRDTTLLVPRRLEDHLFPSRPEVEPMASATIQIVQNSFADTPPPPAVAEDDEPEMHAAPEVQPMPRSARDGDTLRPPALPDLDLGEALAHALSTANDELELEPEPTQITASLEVEAVISAVGTATLDLDLDVEIALNAEPRVEPEPAPEPVAEDASTTQPTTDPEPEPMLASERELENQAKPADLRQAMKRLLRDEPPAREDILHRVEQSATYRNFALDLDAAKGPKPVAVIEKLFAQRYVPLLAAAHRGELDGAALSIAESWRASFAESYENAFASMRATGKRPTMVMDAPDVATRVARLSSARSIKLVLVDSMSFDLGERVQQRISRALDKRAVLVESSTLWSALPTRSYAQMHLLAKGPEGLKDPIAGPPSEPDVTRGRALTTLRRERCGTRELMKLDLVEARLRVQGPAYDERLDALAGEVADALVKFMETLPPRTLVYVFGDHGFVLGAGSNGWATGTAAQGGASPEEVLVPGYGFLVDAVQ